MGTRAFIAFGTPRRWHDAIHLQMSGNPIHVGPWLWEDLRGSFDARSLAARAQFRGHNFRQEVEVDGDPMWYSWAYIIDPKKRQLRVLSTVETRGTWDPKKMVWEWTKPLTFSLDGPEPDWRKIAATLADDYEPTELKPISRFSKARLVRMMRKP